MKRVLLLAIWMLVCLVAQAGDEIEPLDADFLEYLANLEDEDDNWTLLDAFDPGSESTDADREQPARKPEPRKASKEAAKPAVEER